MGKPWETKDWFVSLWNYAPEVTSGLNFAPKIKIHDVTLRDGEQQAGLAFNYDQKIRIAEHLAELGVHRIEAGMPAVSDVDTKVIKDIVKRNLGPEIFVFGRCMVDDVKRAVDCGASGIVIEIPSSEHIIKYAYGWSLEKAIDLSITATQFAKENGLYTVFFPIDASRADMDWVITLLEKVATEGHMDALALVDTFGGLSPHAIPYLVSKIKAKINKPLEAHFHNDFGMGTANTIMALAAGVDVAHTTIMGVGERCGNAPFEEVVVSLLALYNKDIGINTKHIYKTAKLLEEFTGIKIAPNRGIIGDRIFHVEAGIIASWFKNCIDNHPLELFPLNWELVGQENPDVVLGKSCGIDSVAMYLSRIGKSDQLDEEQKLAVVNKIKAKSMEIGGLINMDEFNDIVDEVKAGR
ncbi:MAG: pyruvate carboxyltransferase [Bacillota bacterium]|nr:pyruvate carboxyltransferase [Bacillota bacterium]